jgi:AcrR family transcriptional regulator
MASQDGNGSTATGAATTRPLHAKGRKTRARLLEAGADVFATNGYHAARVDDIVAKASSSHGTFYLYFASKEDLFEQLVAQVATDMQELIDDFPPVANSTKGREALRAWLDRFADMYEHDGPLIRAWTEVELSGAGVGRRGTETLGGLSAAMTASMRLPKSSGLDPGIANLALMTMVERFNYYATTGQVDASRDELLDTLVGIIGAVAFG